MNSYHDQYNYHDGTATRFRFHCAQLEDCQAKPEKNADVKKHRDKRAMDVFPCNGWVKITVSDSSLVEIEITHKISHVPYWPTEIPQNIQEGIQQRAKQGDTPTQVWFNYLINKLVIYSI